MCGSVFGILMPLSHDFIEVTALVDGRKASIRAEVIDAVLDNADEVNDFGRVVRPECRTINYSGHSLDVVESYDEIMNMIWNAEL